MMATFDIILHQGDLSTERFKALSMAKSLAIDTETMGLELRRDRLCVVQLCAGDGIVDLVQFPNHGTPYIYDCPNLIKLLGNAEQLKIYHFARFDLAAINRWLNVLPAPVWCTRTASRLARTFGAKHGLADLCRDFLNIEISKQEQCSNWGNKVLTRQQQTYAASDVVYLHQLKAELEVLLERESRLDIAQSCFDFLPARAQLDLLGWAAEDILAHH